MKVTYKTQKLKKCCTQLSDAKKAYGDKMATKIHQRMNELTAIDSVEEMVSARLGRCHQLKGYRKEEYAVDLIHPFRLLFTKDGIEDRIQVVKIINIEDYH